MWQSSGPLLRRYLPMDAARHGGFPVHLVQRGRRGEACFESEGDCLAYLRALEDCAARLECAVHAYALMGNHVHLLVTPARADGAARLLRGLAERHELEADGGAAREFARTGSNRHGSNRPDSGGILYSSSVSPVHARRYLFACMRYIELNPVRAGFVRHAEEHRWSSYRANALGEDNPLVTPHPLYYALGRTPEARREAYRALFPAMAHSRAMADPVEG